MMFRLACAWCGRTRLWPRFTRTPMYCNETCQHNHLTSALSPARITIP